VGRAAGLEASAAAAAAARGRGLAVERATPEAYAAGHGGEFDAVCLFHVVEHLPAVLPPLRAAARCLRPGGTLYVSVPNRRRTCREPLESLDSPPHHLSRWAPRQLAWLAGALGMRVAALACEPADPQALRIELPRRLSALLGRIPAIGGWLGRWPPRLLERTLFRRSLLPGYARARLLDRIGFRGMSVVAALVPAPGRGGPA
jgi:SAM-dependent methyltransferase